MAFQLRLSEVQAARDIGRRALRTIHIREQDEKLAIWIALLNLEVSYGTEDDVETVFREACQMQDPYTVHERMADIYTAADQISKADATYTAMIENKSFRASTQLWYTYATFLFDKAADPARARNLLSRALQSVHEAEKRALTAKFAALEWKCNNGSVERGRTIFEGLLSEWPKWTQGWDMFVDLERSRISGSSRADEPGHKAATGETTESRSETVSRVRSLYERMAKNKMKKRRARFVFKKWLEFEEGVNGSGSKEVERVKALAREYVNGLQQSGENEE